MALVKFDRGLYRNGNVAKGLNYGQIEENQTWFNRAGMVEAQCALDPDCFSANQVAPLTVSGLDGSVTPAAPLTNKIVAQNGAFLQIDKVNYLATIPTQAGKNAGMPVGINYSSEKLYDDFKKARRNFFLTTRDWLPRIGYVEKGMRITTNTVQWDDSAAFAYSHRNAQGAVVNESIDFTALIDETYSYDMFGEIKKYVESKPIEPLYAAVVDGSDGELVINPDGLDVTDPSTYIVLAQVVAAYDNADRTCSFMFQILDGGTK
jgi:hypothetical protein